MFLQQFNAGLFDYLIATDDNSQTKAKEEAKDEDNKDNNKKKRRFKPKLDAEFGVVRGIDFKKVHTVCISFFLFALDSLPYFRLYFFYVQVINYDMPQSVTGYIHRIGRTGRAYSSGSSVSLVSFFYRCSIGMVLFIFASLMICFVCHRFLLMRWKGLKK